MPLYEYQCDKCAHRFEVIQKYSDPHVDVCPKCGGPVKKLLSSPAIQFKGTGWYITDYPKSGSSKTESKTESNSESKSESKTETKSTEKSTESKGETKPPSGSSPKD